MTDFLQYLSNAAQVYVLIVDLGSSGGGGWAMVVSRIKKEFRIYNLMLVHFRKLPRGRLFFNLRNNR